MLYSGRGAQERGRGTSKQAVGRVREPRTEYPCPPHGFELALDRTSAGAVTLRLQGSGERVGTKPDLDLERWVEAWRLAGPELERIRRREMDGASAEARSREIDGLLQLAFELAVPRTTSGLIEQQRLFGMVHAPTRNRRP